MKSLADGLPPEIARQIHPDWRKNEAAYWTERDRLLAQYQGQWVAFADGAVLVAASTPLEVFLAIQGSQQHPFVIRVGHETEPWYRIRRAEFPCQLQGDFAGHERILGRDGLNRLEVLFRAPLAPLAFNPYSSTAAHPSP